MNINKREFCQLKQMISIECNNPEYGFDLNPEEFAIEMGCLNPQEYGKRIEDYLSFKLKLNKCDDKNRGDKISLNNKYIEIKGSLCTMKNRYLNLRQIRLWQDVDYILYAFDIKDTNNIKIYFNYLTNEQMKSEEPKMRATHNTKKANEINNNIDKSLSINIDNYDDWNNKYGITIDELFNKLNK